MDDIWAEVMRLVSVWGLWVLLPVTIIEGPVATVIAGWLIKIGALPILPTFAAVLAGSFHPRVKELDSGAVKTIPWAEARRLILRDTDVRGD